MESIGGYFELELVDRGEFIHDDGILVNTGRNALELILSNLSNAQGSGGSSDAVTPTGYSDGREALPTGSEI